MNNKKIIIYFLTGLVVLAILIINSPPGNAAFLTGGANYWAVNGNDTYNTTGNIGIGLSNPTYRLHVTGTSYLNGQITTSLSGTGNRCVYVDANGNLLAKTVDCGTATGGDNMGNHIATQNIRLGNYWLSGDGGAEGVFVNSAGNVGIGTSAPTQTLNVNGTFAVRDNSADRIILSFNDNYTGEAKLRTIGGGGWVLESTHSNAPPMVFRLGDGANVYERMRIMQSGNVGIGTTAPAQMLHVAGNVQANSFIGVLSGNAATASALAENGANCSVGYYPLGVTASGAAENCTLLPASGSSLPSGTSGDMLRYNGTDWVANSVIYNNGTNVGIGTTNPTSKLRVYGTVNISKTTSEAENIMSLSGTVNTITSGNAWALSVFHNYTPPSNSTAQIRGISGYVTVNPTASASYNASAYGNLYGAFNSGVGSASNLYGGAFYTRNNSSGSIYNAFGVRGFVDTADTAESTPGSITNAYGGSFGVSSVANGGTITNAYGAYIASGYTKNGGTITNNYGLYISSQTAGSNSNYAIYANSGTNYFAGNVGIGTSNPTYRLQVSGTSYLNGQITTSLSGTGNRCVYVDSSGNLLAKSTDCGTATGGDNLGNHIATQNIQLGNYWLSGDGGAEGVFVTAAGNVGVGTSAPAQRLHVNGSVQATSFIGALSGNASTATALAANGANCSAGYYPLGVNAYGAAENCTLLPTGGASLPSGSSGQTLRHDGSSWVANSAIYNNGTNVGIGTTAPNDRLVVSNGTGEIRFGGSNGRTLSAYYSGALGNFDFRANSTYFDSHFILASRRQIQIYNYAGNSAAYGRIYVPSNENLTFEVNGSDRLSINSAGNVGIGTTNPAQRLHVVGTSYLNGQITTSLSGTGNRCVYVDSSGNLLAKSTDCGTATGGDNLGNHIATQNIQLGNYWLSGDGGAEGVFVTAAGNVGVGTSAPAQRLHVNGSVQATSFIGSLSGNASTATALAANGANCSAGYYPLGVNAYGAAENCTLLPTGGASLPSGSSGQTLRHDGSNWITNSNIFNNGTNVGIGTTNPGYKLDIAGNVNIAGALYISSADFQLMPQLYLSYEDNAVKYASDYNTVFTRNSYRHLSFDHPQENYNVVYFQSATNPDVSNNEWGSLGHDSTNFLIKTGANTGTGSAPTTRENAIVFAPRGTEQMRITGNGNVGIGTTAPTQKLHVNGHVRATNFYGAFVGNASTATALAADGTNCAAGSYPRGVDAAGNAQDCTVAGALPSGTASYTLRHNGTTWVSNSNIYNNGTNVGIGTTAPSRKLHVVGTSYLNGQITTSLSGTGNRCVYVDSSGNLLAKSADCGTATGGDNMGNHTATQNIQLGNYWLSGDGGAEGVFVTADGNVGVGTSAPSDRLVVNGNIRATNYRVSGTTVVDSNRNFITTTGTAAAPAVRSSSYSNTGLFWAAGPVLGFATGGDERMRIDGAGNVSIGTTTNSNNYKLIVDGTVGAGAYVYNSDRNLKTNIKTIDNSLEKITSLRGVYFNWKTDANSKRNIGLIAQEVEKVFPELVRGEEGNKGVEYGNLVAPLIEAIKEQQKQINDLNARIKKLEALIP